MELKYEKKDIYSTLNKKEIEQVDVYSKVFKFFKNRKTLR